MPFIVRTLYIINNTAPFIIKEKAFFHLKKKTIIFLFVVASNVARQKTQKLSLKKNK